MDYAKWSFWLMIGNILLVFLAGILLKRRSEAPKNLPVVSHEQDRIYDV
jgi:hypothetical protein